MTDKKNGGIGETSMDKNKIIESDDSNQTSSRRNIIKKTLVGGAVIGGTTQLKSIEWSKPVIDSVLIPAHATTTDIGGEADPCGGVPLDCMSTDPTAGRRRIFNRNTATPTVVGSVRSLTATVCPPQAGVNVTLNATSGNPVNATLDQIFSFDPPNMLPVVVPTDAMGVATFSEVTLQFDVTDRDSPSSMNLNLMFSVGADTCDFTVPISETAFFPLPA